MNLLITHLDYCLGILMWYRCWSYAFPSFSRSPSTARIHLQSGRSRGPGCVTILQASCIKRNRCVVSVTSKTMAQRMACRSSRSFGFSVQASHTCSLCTIFRSSSNFVIRISSSFASPFARYAQNGGIQRGLDLHDTYIKKTF